MASTTALPTSPYLALEPILHNGKTYLKNSTLFANAADGNRLVDLGVAVAIEMSSDGESASGVVVLDGMTKAQLKDHAFSVFGLELKDNMKVPDMIAAITAAAIAKAAAGQVS